MKKSFFVTIFALMISLVLSGCTQAPLNNLCETTYGVYDLYCNCMLKCQTEISQNISVQDFSGADQNKANTVLSKLSILPEEEIAVIASVECYNMVSTPKSVTMDMYGGLINVRQQQDGKFNCDLSYDSGTTANYVFEIDRSNSTSPCVISYKKQNNNCSANVLFNQKTGSISLTLTSFNENNQKVVISKQFYLLQNNHMALRINFSIGSASNKVNYGIDYFREVFNFNAKISVLQTIGGAINQDNLTIDRFVTAFTNDICGYILKHKDGKATEVTTFGDLNNWAK